MSERRRVTVDELTGYFLSSPEFHERMQGVGGMARGGLERVDLDNGLRLYLRRDDGVGEEIKERRSYEEHVSQELLRLLRPGSVFVDVGASVGYFTILAGRAAGPEGKVIACEPGPQNHTALLLNTMVNGLDNVRVVPCAVSDSASVVLYHRLGGGNGSITSYDGDPASIGSRDLIRTRTLDDILGGEPRVDVVKIDVEGAEGRVMAGASETLRRHRPTLLFEFSPPGLQAVSGVTGDFFLRNLAALGYEFRLLSGEDRATIPAAAVLRSYRRQSGDHIDVMAVAAR